LADINPLCNHVVSKKEARFCQPKVGEPEKKEYQLTIFISFGIAKVPPALHKPRAKKFQATTNRPDVAAAIRKTASKEVVREGVMVKERPPHGHPHHAPCGRPGHVMVCPTIQKKLGLGNHMPKSENLLQAAKMPHGP
jgi:hypothetical protein